MPPNLMAINLSRLEAVKLCGWCQLVPLVLVWLQQIRLLNQVQTKHAATELFVVALLLFAPPDASSPRHSHKKDCPGRDVSQTSSHHRRTTGLPKKIEQVVLDTGLEVCEIERLCVIEVLCISVNSDHQTQNSMYAMRERSNRLVYAIRAEPSWRAGIFAHSIVCPVRYFRYTCSRQLKYLLICCLDVLRTLSTPSSSA